MYASAIYSHLGPWFFNLAMEKRANYSRIFLIRNNIGHLAYPEVVDNERYC